MPDSKSSQCEHISLVLVQLGIQVSTLTFVIDVIAFELTLLMAHSTLVIKHRGLLLATWSTGLCLGER